MRKRTTIYVLLVLLVMVCEYVLIIWTQKYGADRDVVSHVGFAGTIVSMLLAAIAIIYSYFQTFLQQRDSQSLAAQLNNLRDLAGTLRDQGTQFGGFSKQIEGALAAAGRTE